MKNNTKFSNALQEAGLTLAEFCRFWNLPYRTAQDWKNGKRRTPAWVFVAVKIYAWLKEKNLLENFKTGD